MALTFCPNCSNALTISRTPGTTEYPDGVNRFECRTCPYQFILDKPYYERTTMKRKQVEDVLGASTGWESRPEGNFQCEAEGCDSAKANYYELQTRSADEPMTKFLRCVKCHHEWREY